MFIRNQYVVAGKMKTAIIKSFPELKYFLEKGLALQVRTSSFGRLNKIGRKFQELIDARRNELKQSLTDDDIQQLLNLREIVPAGCTMLFLPGFVQPILSFNIDRVPLFDSGWLFHATPGDNLTRIASSGFIEAPLSVIRMKKNYFSTRFASDSSARRLTDGISFAFQNYYIYQGYMSDKNGRNIGGFFLFPFKSVLSKDLLLDTDSIDNYEGAREVLLKHKSYLQGSPKLIARLLVLAQYHYPAWLKDYDFTKVFFEEAKSHIEELKKLSAFNRFLRHKVGSKWHFDFKLPNGEEQTIISGQGLFYEMLSKIDLESKGELEKLANFAAENNFLFFSLYLNFRRVSIYPSDGAFTPILATFKQSQAPLALSGTIFQQQNTYLWEEKAVESPNLGAQLLTLTLMKNQPNISQYGDARDYIAVMKKMSPVKVKQLFELTRTEIIKLLDSMVNQRFADCKVDVTRGVLFLNTAYTNIDTLNALVKLGVPIFCNFSNNGVFFINWELEFFIDQVLQPVKLNLPESYFVQKNQFYLKGDLVVMYNPEKGTIQKVAD